MRIILFTISFFCFFNAAAQKGDFLILKKKSKVVKMYFEGSQIEFITTTGAYRNAVITDIKNDSIFLREFVIRRIPTTLGFYIIDTVGSFRYSYNYKQIYKFSKENKKFNTRGSAGALFTGGLLLTLASGVVYAVDKTKFSFPLLAAGATLGTIGYFWSKGAGKGITIGRNKYSMQYINISTKTNEEQK
jgi:hypothetical protein